MKKVIKIADLLNPETLKGKIENLVEWKNLTIKGGYNNNSINADDMYDWAIKYGEMIKKYITDTTIFLRDASNEGKKIMFEAQLGALRDIDFGIFPYTSSSPTIASYAPIGAGVPFLKLDNVIGIMKAYSSCVGEGPFTAEIFGKESDDLREAGGEYGAATGRPRRVGWFDVPASKYGVTIQGADILALTKLDVLSYLDKIPVCTHYEIDGEKTTEFMTGDKLLRAKPVVEYLEGFKTDISNCKSKEELPKTCIDYIKYLEKAVGCPIKYVSVGASRDQYLEMY